MNDSGTSTSICAETEPAGGLTLRGLFDQYRADPVSGWQRLRYATRRTQETVVRRWVEAYGDMSLSTIKRRDLEAMYLRWTQQGQKISMGHAFMACLRTACSYGGDMLELPECDRLSMLLSKRRFPMGQARKDYVTAEQCVAVREMARNYGYNSIALAQAIQFELILRQKDVIGEWVPANEPGDSDVHYHGEKWLRGLRWEEIDGDLVLRHMTSKKGKVLTVDLKLAPMVLEEIRLLPDFMKQSRGPIIISEHNCMPWQAVASFRHHDDAAIRPRRRPESCLGSEVAPCLP